MSQETKKSPHYVLVMDEKRNDILSLMYNVLAQIPVAKLTFNFALERYKIPHADVEAFTNEWTNKEHELGWCKDPDCKVPNKKHR